MKLNPRSRGLTVVLGALVALAPLTVAIGLPALPLLERGLAAAPGQAALVLGLVLLSLALPQLLIGPLSDRHGRRPVLLASLALYVAAALGAALAGPIWVLLALRVLQGIAAAFCAVLAFAMLRDVAEGVLAQVRLSSMTMMYAVAPIFAPALGGVVLALAGWPGIYALLALIGLLLLAVVAVAVPETRPPAPAGRPLGALARYAVVLRLRGCVGHAAVGALNFGGLFSFVASAPSLLVSDLGVSAELFGGLFAIISGGVLAGGWVNRVLSVRGVSSAALLDWGLVLSLIASALLSLLLSFTLLRLGVVVPLLLAVSFCHGLVWPNAMHAVLALAAAHAGAASALAGCARLLMGAAAGAAMALLYPALGPLGMTLSMTLFAGAALAARGFARAQGPGLLLSRAGR